MLSKNFVTLGGSGPFRIEDNLEELLKYYWYHRHKVKGAHVPHCQVHKLPSMILLKVTAGMETHSFFNIYKFTGISWSFSDTFSKACFVAHWQTRGLLYLVGPVSSAVQISIFSSSSLLMQCDSKNGLELLCQEKHQWGNRVEDIQERLQLTSNKCQKLELSLKKGVISGPFCSTVRCS